MIGLSSGFRTCCLSRFTKRIRTPFLLSSIGLLMATSPVTANEALGMPLTPESTGRLSAESERVAKIEAAPDAGASKDADVQETKTPLSPTAFGDVVQKDDSQEVKVAASNEDIPKKGAVAKNERSSQDDDSPYLAEEVEEESVDMGGLLALAGLKRWSLGGYGEVLLTTEFFGPDPTKEYSPSDYKQTSLDFARLVFFIGYEFTDWLSFESEIEFEHGGTGATMEVEWDEFGEYELEVEKGGEIVVEQAFLEATFARYFALRLGHLLVPVGMTSMYHTPNLFASPHRAESESHLIPSTWHETGAELAFRFKGLSVFLQGISGLDSTGFSSSRWIAGGTQRRFESVTSNDWAVALRIDYAGFKGLVFGVSGYTSNTTRNRPKRDMYDERARVFIGDLHLRFNHGPFRVRALGMLGHLTGADLITEKNSSLSQYLEVPRTPVASSTYAYYLEASVDLIGMLKPDSRQRFDLFLHYDGYDTMWKGAVPDSGFADPLFQRQVLTGGVGYYPHPRVVLKWAYLHRWINKNESWDRRQHEINVGLGFVL